MRKRKNDPVKDKAITKKDSPIIKKDASLSANEDLTNRHENIRKKMKTLNQELKEVIIRKRRLYFLRKSHSTNKRSVAEVWPWPEIKADFITPFQEDGLIKWHTIHDISDKYGIDYSTVYCKVRNDGWIELQTQALEALWAQISKEKIEDLARALPDVREQVFAASRKLVGRFGDVINDPTTPVETLCKIAMPLGKAQQTAFESAGVPMVAAPGLQVSVGQNSQSITFDADGRPIEAKREITLLEIMQGKIRTPSKPVNRPDLPTEMFDDLDLPSPLEDGGQKETRTRESMDDSYVSPWEAQFERKMNENNQL